MKIIVTGGAGFIGHHVVNKLETLGHDVLVIDNKTHYGLIPWDELKYLFEQRTKNFKAEIIDECVSSVWAARELEFFKPDAVIHLASYPRQKVVNKSPVFASRIMCTGLLNLLEECKKLPKVKFVYASSSMVYGDFEDDVSEDAVCRPQGQYGILKLAGEWLLKDYARQNSNFTYTIVRPSAVYGPLDVQDRVISKFMLAALQGKTLNVNGPDETLDFTFVDDAARGIVDATLSDNTHNRTYNITKSHSWTLASAAELAVAIAGRGTIMMKERDPDFPSRGALNISAARRDFGFHPVVDVEEGFRRYAEWYKTSPFWSSKIS